MAADDVPMTLAGDIRIPAGRGKLAIDYTASSLNPERMSFRISSKGSTGLDRRLNASRGVLH